jgi:DNA-binding CsgD family transcriptional regulator
VYSEPAGEVSIFYLEERPPADEGPFLKEERALLDALADQIGTIATRISAEMELQEINKQLSLERKALQESNLALRTVLTKIEEDKNEIYRNIKTNVDKVIMPILLALALEVPQKHKNYIEMLRNSLEEIASQFTRQLSTTYHSLTPTEITICNMIRNGMRTKEIAQIRGVSMATINRHRENIRRKLKITNDNVNLSTYLQSSMWEEDTKF